jgi:hypothetical protein
MLVVALMTVLCAAGITFYVRFLLALHKERKPRVVGYLVIPPSSASEKRTAELRPWKEQTTRAA